MAVDVATTTFDRPPMKFVVPVSIREYPQTDESVAMVIAETLDPPFLCVAAPDEETARTELQLAVVRAMELAHPRMIGHLDQRGAPTMERVTAPVHGTAAFEWHEDEGVWQVDNQPCPSPIDVVRRDIEGGFVHVSLDRFATWTIIPPDADDAADQTAVRDLSDVLRGATRHTIAHRPLPASARIEMMEAEFEPLDLCDVAVETVWQTEFEAGDFEAAPSDERPFTPTLDDVAQCWSEGSLTDGESRGFVESFGRQATIAELRELLDASAPSAVVLVGPARVGKTALVKHLAWERRHRQNTSARALWFADPPRMTSTDAFAMDWREQCRALVAELEETGDVLYLGRLIESLDAGKYVGSDYNLAQFLKPVLSDRRIRVIAEATPQQWNEIERRDIGFARTFTVVRVDDPPPQISQEIVQRAVLRAAEREGVSMDNAAIARAWMLQSRFAVDGSPLGRTIDFVRRSLRVAGNAFQQSLNEQDLVRAFCRTTGLPEVLLSDDRQLDLDRVRATLSRRVLGQEEAVHRVADVIGITKAGLASPDRPLGSFLFVGPTGVGKTELARALAAYLFGDEDRLVRIDMSEYSHPDAYARLIGEGRSDGDLTGPVRRQPFCVVLLDEIEKASRSVFDLLLQVLGEARLTDVDGRMTSFRNVIVIMTSNLGVDTLRPAIGFGEESIADSWGSHFRREAERFFRPEFLARIDQFIAFRPLSQDVVERIAEREVAAVRERDGLTSQHVELEIDERVYSWLAARGFDPRYGARPLKRVIERELVAELARRLAEPGVDGDAWSVAIEVPEGKLTRVGLRWTVDAITGRRPDATARTVLLDHLERIAELRRRLQRYISSAVFADLQWRVENFDVSSQSEQFWDGQHASDLATEAEHARRVIDPTHVIAGELAAMEDLATEAYHGRSFDLSADIGERIDELADRTKAVSKEILRGAYEEPDRITLFVHAKPAHEPWRRQLLQWWQQRATAQDWTLTVWRPRPHSELAHIDLEDETPWDEEQRSWEQTTLEEANGEVVAIDVMGHAARPLWRSEDGLHRLVSPDGNAMVDAWERDEYAGWPWAQRLEGFTARSYEARTYNFRTREITSGHYPAVKLDPDDPFVRLEELIEDIAWRITDSEWE